MHETWTCRVSLQVVWLDHREKLLTFEDRRIIADERISLERPYVKEWNLHIRNVRAADEGVFTCQINTDPVQIRPIWLHIHGRYTRPVLPYFNTHQHRPRADPPHLAAHPR